MKVESASLHYAWNTSPENGARFGVTVSWSAGKDGFGQTTLYVRDGKLQLETETLGLEFAKEVFMKLLESAEVVE